MLAAVDQDKRLATRAAGVWGVTLLHNASRGGHVELAGSLLDRGASLTAKHARGYDALYFASVGGRHGHLAVAALLLDRGQLFGPSRRERLAQVCCALTAAATTFRHREPRGSTR